MVRVLLGMAAVALAVTGQFWMRLTPDGLAPGLALMAIAAALLVLGSMGRLPAALVRLASRWSITRFGLLVGVAILLAVIAAAAAVTFERMGLVNFTPVSLLLAVGALTYALA